ncbi:MAG: hypothetical protein A2Y62_21340 [Candidatus Fischerbacteria bacterium RBG_13_37_8]|uniref:Uncharacterized protein n=1 Tax=Candidatus Fischerbacteria bacterium RBG_13_37_8 TaxID=1817863 RepID=A0A1F5VTH7_9BACT|nr:MAG: hypothetical protein A2Y62_21340 [Candidatus Fischerbacteria bacterium RBG_13_37_8]
MFSYYLLNCGLGNMDWGIGKSLRALLRKAHNDKQFGLLGLPPANSHTIVYTPRKIKKASDPL